MAHPRFKPLPAFTALALLASAAFGFAATSLAAGNTNSAQHPARPALDSSPTGKIPMNAPLPLFYRELVAFDARAHGHYAFPAEAANYRFAAQTNVIPLLVNEIPFALQSYPLVFLPAGPNKAATLAALVGIGDGQNRFVKADGQWRSDSYVPAWVRRYPFIAVNTETQADPVLALDPSAEWLNAKGGEALIGADGKPSARLDFILNFQREFAEFARRTQAMVTALEQAEVFEEGTLRIEAPAASQGEPPKEVRGFLIVSESKLRALRTEQLAQLHQADALGLAYAQLFSMANLAKVMANPVNPLATASGGANASGGQDKVH